MCCAHSQIFRHKTKSYNLKLITASMYVSEYDMLILLLSLRKKCPYSELFLSVFSRFRTEYGEILCISPYSIQMRQKADQNNYEYWHFLGNVCEVIVFLP